ncbi:glycoside hydrolase family 95-like protein [Pilimelia columellifera]|uniref:glycoside hydrolase family 95-like protein n=1 Tax=Pilimelia columellifera TaxID=706574 RepID=UPI0031D1E15F
MHEAVVRDAAMLWTRPPTGWWNAPFVGDGVVVAQVYTADHGTNLTFAVSPAGTSWETPTSRFTLPLAGTVTEVRWELNPWDAELTGVVTTTRGSLLLTATVPRGSGVLLVSVQGRAGEQRTSPLSGGSDGFGWHDRRDGSQRWIVVGQPGHSPRRMLAADLNKIRADHRRWWHDYYAGSFVSVPDKTLQRFHWLQVYAAASIARSDPAGGLDTPATLAATNHLELHPASNAAAEGGWPQSFEHLLSAMPGAGLKSGDTENPIMAWNLPEIWASYRYSLDDRVLRDVLQPMLRSAVGHYANSLVDGEGGRLHLPSTYAPGFGDVEDCTYDLSLLRWAATRLVESARPGTAGYGELHRWRSLLQRLVPYHTDDSGVLIGAGVRLPFSQPNPSHLLWMHPLGEKSWRRAADRQLMRRSLEHWSSMPTAWNGRSYLSAAAMAVTTDAPEEALGWLRQVTDGGAHADSRMLPIGLYREGRGLQTGGSFEAAQVMLRMLVSGDEIVEVFGGLPKSWHDVSVSGLRAPGAFVLDASRSAGRTDWVRVHSDSKVDRSLLLRHGIAGPVEVRDEAGRRVATDLVGPGVLRLRPRAGATLEVHRVGSDGSTDVRNVTALSAGRRWGYTATSAEDTEFTS